MPSNGNGNDNGNGSITHGSSLVKPDDTDTGSSKDVGELGELAGEDKTDDDDDDDDDELESVNAGVVGNDEDEDDDDIEENEEDIELEVDERCGRYGWKPVECSGAEAPVGVKGLRE
ncbi:hypothetical protein BGZ54_009430 [Gamsiella multidivaricata]|nr:hypothetical protein BGZ54_009430 [Gamsiella multidivaricata]